MNLSIEDLEAIKAIVREVVREELARVEAHRKPAPVVSQSVAEKVSQEPKHVEQSQEVVARIPRT